MAFDYLMGAIAGTFGVFISHPFDTIKSNIQNNQIVKYGLKNLYKGLIPPLIGTSVEKSIVFGTYNNLKNKYELPIYICGGISGFIACFIITPYERIKILQQNSINLTKQITIKSLYSGFSMCVLRDSLGFAIYFSNYEYLKQKLYTNNNQPITKLGAFLLGGSSGLISWVFIYPQDKIKTIIQSQNIDSKINIKEIITNINKQGLKSFYNGFHFALFRAIPLHAGTFMMYEILS